MKIKGPLIKGNFIDRPNRFLTIVKIKDKYVKSHLPDPGRLKEILTPGRVLFLRKDKFSTNRKTRYTTVLTDINMSHFGIFGIQILDATPGGLPSFFISY